MLSLAGSCWCRHCFSLHLSGCRSKWGVFLEVLWTFWKPSVLGGGCWRSLHFTSRYVIENWYSGKVFIIWLFFQKCWILDVWLWETLKWPAIFNMGSSNMVTFATVSSPNWGEACVEQPESQTGPSCLGTDLQSWIVSTWLDSTLLRANICSTYCSLNTNNVKLVEIRQTGDLFTKSPFVWNGSFVVTVFCSVHVHVFKAAERPHTHFGPASVNGCKNIYQW